MLNYIDKQKLAKSVFKGLLIFSTLFLVACQGAPKFPTKTMWEVDTVNRVCGEYLITDPVNFKYQFVKDWPLDKCDGVFGFSTEDTPKIISWLKAIKKYYEQTCNNFDAFLDQN